MRRLPDTSLTSALAQGGYEHFGWGQDRHISADLYDAITFNTEHVGHYKKPLPTWPRPKTRTSEAEKKKVTVRDLWNRLGGAKQH